MKLLAKRIAQLAVVLVVVTFVAFGLSALGDGDPVSIKCSQGCNEAQRAEVTRDLGLDRPFIVQYGDWLGNFLTGDMGRFYDNEQPIIDNVKTNLPVSVLLLVYAQVIALVVAIPLGVLTAYRAGSRLDRVLNAGAFGAIAVPNFVLAFYLLVFLALRANLFPFGSYTSLREDPVMHFKSMFLPALSLSIGQIAVYMRLLRSDMIQTLQEDFILMAKAKGMSTRRILFRHALRPSSLTLLTVMGLNIGTLIGGSVIIENIFGLPGMGRQIVQAISTSEDLALVSYVAIIGVTYVTVNFVIDFLYNLVDPRVRAS